MSVIPITLIRGDDEVVLGVQRDARAHQPGTHHLASGARAAGAADGDVVAAQRDRRPGPAYGSAHRYWKCW